MKRVQKSSRHTVSAVLILCFILVFQVKAEASEPYDKIANSKEWAVLKEVNKQRLQNGQAAISMFSGIQKAAGIRAEEIVSVFSHSRPDGSAWSSALQDCDVDYGYAGENIAAGYGSVASVMAGWMNSPGHRSNILGSSYHHVGVGYCTGGYYGKNWVQMFVGGCKVKSVAVDDKGTVNYPVGTSINKMNRYLIVKCNKHGVSYVPVIKEMCSGYDSSKEGYQTVMVAYQSKKVKMPVTVGNVSSYKQPKQVKSLKASSVKKKSVKLTWKKTSGEGYEIWRATSKNGTYKKVKTISSSKTKSYRVKNLKSGKKYYFKVRAFKKSGGKKIYGAFSKAVVVKTK